MPENEAPDSVRLDVWLWAARFFKTRSQAKQAADAGRVLVEGQPAKPSRLLKRGQRLIVQRAGEDCAITVLALSERRGSAADAARLYVEAAESIAAREAERAARRAGALGYRPPEGRPERDARRQLGALKLQDREGD
ncbi:MAG: S4 domain-containing protein [Xanthomonadales bacterium]|jgi:ribosome-associated heat shock protein Hsp15|nr:S4 domain-containing protein [Xanthomonadales bacterium]